MSRGKVYETQFGKMYQILLNKVLKKERTEEEFMQVLLWFGGYTPEQIQEMREDEYCSYKDFFDNAPCLNPNRTLIKGTVCRVRIEEISDPLMLEIRRMDKLVDDLANGKSMDKILRKPEEEGHS